MGVVDGEEERGFFGAERVEAIGFDGGHIDYGNLLGFGDLGFVLAEAHVAFNLEIAVSVVHPDVADGDGEEDGSGFLRAGVCDVFANVPAVGVDGLGGLAGEGSGGEGFREMVFDGLVADAFDAAAGLGIGGGIAAAAVVVAHLDEDEVAGLHLGEDAGPAAFVVITAGAAAGHCSVSDVDFCGVEVVGEVVAPAEVGLVAGGGVADDEEGGESGVERSVLRDAGLGRRVGSFRGGGGLGGAGDGEEKTEQRGEGPEEAHGR